MEEALTLVTDNPDVRLRVMTTEQEDYAFFFGVDEDREHLSQHGDKTGQRYIRHEDVTNARLKAGDSMRFGIWSGDRFVGNINATPVNNGLEVEVGYWLRKSAVGHGYATLAVSALTEYLKDRYERVYARVHVGNEASMHVLQRAGYIAVGFTLEKWGMGIVFEPRQTETS